MAAVSFLDVEKSAMVEARLRELGGRLERYDNRIKRSQMTVSRPIGSEPRVAVKIHLSLPGAWVHAEGERTCLLECENNTIHEAVLLAASDAFDSARRQLSELSMMRGGQRP